MLGPLKLTLMFVRKIADFRPPKQPYSCPGIADFRSGKAEPCPGIADLGPDQLKKFGKSIPAHMQRCTAEKFEPYYEEVIEGSSKGLLRQRT